MRVRPLEVSALKLFRSLGSQKALVAVSGGVDSMALAHLCANLQKKVQLQFVVAHVHHGSKFNKKFRDQAQNYVRQECAQLGLDFVTNTEGEALSNSESDLRKFRLAQLKSLKTQTQSQLVLFAHHADDLLETRLIRLARGTGPRGLRSMSVVNKNVVRPFLQFSKAEVELYLGMLEGDHLEDPSNRSVEYFRNWIRREWLPLLEAKRPGSVRKLRGSFESLVEALDERPAPIDCLEEDKIVRSRFIVLSPSDKRRVIGDYLQNRGFQDYGLSHINELMKRLDVEQKVLTFRLLKKIWLANAKHIWCE